jgi:hypothetical protein
MAETTAAGSGAVTVAGKATPRGRFPHVKVVGDLVFVSGTSSRLPDNTIAGASADEFGATTLDIRVQTREGAVLEVTEEQDELVRAAEELGIELAPVSSRATADSPSAQDIEEGNDKVDPDGIFNIAADETTSTIDLDAELAGVTVDDEEKEDPLGAIEIDDDVTISDLGGGAADEE